MKKLSYLLLIMVVSFISVSSVDAEADKWSYNFKFLNRTYDSLPFDTWYDVNEVTTYNNSNEVIFNGVSQNGGSLSNLPRYIYIVLCATGGIDFGVSGTPAYGNLSNGGTINGGTCTTQGYTGSYKLQRYTVYDWEEISTSNGVNYGVRWTVRASNLSNWPNYVSVQSVFLSNELIEDFGNSQLLTELLNQNNQLKSQLNDIENYQSETNNKLDETNGKLDETNEQLGDVNNNITNDDVGGVDSAFDSFEGFVSENSTITELITMPITLYTSILNGMKSTCTPFVLGDLFGTNLTIPCINLGSYLGSTLWGTIDIIISGFAVFSISKKLIKIFNNFSSMKEGDVIDD